jgi:hypothetical protein
VTSFKIAGKRIAFGLPKRFEIFLLVMYSLLLFLFDINQNKRIDFGPDYMVTVFEGFKINAGDLALVALILFHLVLFTLFVYSLKRPGTHEYWDIAIGALALFGVAILLAGYMNEINNVPTYFFVELESVSFYHIGIAFQIIAAVYWSLTD